MIETMKALLKENDICVLATVSGKAPHCSLMAYTTDEDGTETYMVTHRETAKYKNITENPAVSLLIDTREKHPGTMRPEVKAMTVEGWYERLEDARQTDRIRERLLERHPHLRSFMDHPDAEILRINIRSFLLLDGLSDSYYEKI